MYMLDLYQDVEPPIAITVTFTHRVQLLQQTWLPGPIGEIYLRLGLGADISGTHLDGHLHRLSPLVLAAIHKLASDTISTSFLRGICVATPFLEIDIKSGTHENNGIGPIAAPARSQHAARLIEDTRFQSLISPAEFGRGPLSDKCSTRQTQQISSRTTAPACISSRAKPGLACDHVS